MGPVVATFYLTNFLETDRLRASAPEFIPGGFGGAVAQTAAPAGGDVQSNMLPELLRRFKLATIGMKVCISYSGAVQKTR